ncbi:MAG: hypothetical protein ACR2IT_10245, partial [Pirellulales bacterium]
MRCDFRINVAGQTVEVTGDGAVAGFRPAFCRLEVPGSGHADALLHVATAADPCQAAGPLEVGLNRFADGSFAVLRTAPPMFEVFRPADVSLGRLPQLELVVSPEAAAAGDVLAQPGHVAIAAWLAAQGSCLMHAAGVAIDGRGVMLVGAGGRGKTTTALAATLRGFSYLGDDLCIVSPDPSGQGGHLLQGLYATAKLNPDTREHLGLAGWPVLGTTPQGKAVASLPPAIAFACSVPLVAIVHVNAFAIDGPRVARLSHGEAVRQLGTASGPMLRTAGPSGKWLRMLAMLARDVPVLSLSLDWDLDRVVASLAAIASAAEPGRADATVGRASAGKRAEACSRHWTVPRTAPSGFDVPVAIVAYNRPAKLRRLLETLAQVRPATLLLIADGPNATR